MAHFDPAVVVEMDRILGMEGQPKSKWNLVTKLLLDSGIAYKVEQVDASLLVVHTANRSGLGINAHHAHKTLKTVVTSGADKGELLKATAFEIPRDGPRRANVMAFNQALVQAAAGLLAPINGNELGAATLALPSKRQNTSV